MIRPGATAVDRALEEAQRCVYEAETLGRRAHYEMLVRNLVLLIGKHGLGQTLAYLEARGTDRYDSPYQLLAGHLAHWLATTLDLDEALSALTTEDSELYMQATDEAYRFALALKRALGPKEEDV